MKVFFAAAIIFISCSPAHFIKKEIKKTEQQLQEHLGFHLLDFDSKKTLIKYQSRKYFTPASNTKIFTFYTSLRLLGDSIASLKYFIRNDSLFFQGVGDPSFLYKNVHDNGRVYKFLKERPEKLFFSSTNFQTEKYGPGWAWDDYNEYYSAERSPFPLYGNVVSIQKNKLERLTAQPPFFDSLILYRPEIHAREEIIRDYHTNGLSYFAGKRKSKDWTIPFQTSDSLTVKLLSDTLHRPIGLKQITLPLESKTLKSTPSDSVYKVMMQESDNFIAEQLLLQCASVVSDTLKPEIAIRYSLKNFLSNLPDKPLWVDGSGLSRYNLFTPRTMVALWEKFASAVPKERLFKILAVGGKSGTIKNSYKADKPFLFAKTGTLSNNHSLSGFLVTKKNKLFIFSFMNNNFPASSGEVRKHIESILKNIRDKF
ncbi:MAG: D-alanyl-D-alanine carboxypeptidase [Bacteroidetes bacterium]|nr:D-alanyl-D-alanine carboxypeptidase [Bacteroidota bacterium]